MTLLRGAGAPLLGAIAAILAAGTARAQSAAHFDLGSGSATYDNAPGTAIVVFSPGFAYTGRPLSLHASGVWTSFDRGGWTGQGTLAVSWLPSVRVPLHPELSARLDASTRRSGLRSGQATGQIRLHYYPGYGSGLWAGIVAGQAWHGFRSEPLARGELGAWGVVGQLRVHLSLATARVSDSVPRVAWLQGLTQNEINGARLDTLTSRPDTLFASRTTGYTEAATSAEWRAGPLEMSGSVARRFGYGRTADATSWSGSALLWLTSRLGLVVGGGRYPADLAQAHPGGRYATLSLRVALQPEERRLRLRSVAPAPRSAPGVSRFDIAPASGSRFVVRVRAPGASSVEIMGDFSDWRPVPLTGSSDGSWVVALDLEPGTYRMNLRLDGRDWIVPPGLAPQPDEFGGTAGVLIVGLRASR